MKSKGGCAPLPAAPPPKCDGSQELWNVLFLLFPLISGIFVDAAIVFTPTQKRISETFTHTVQRRAKKVVELNNAIRNQPEISPSETR